MEICGDVKSYDWGRAGRDSRVATLALANQPSFAGSFSDDKPYAELWMGDHVSGPSTVKATGESLAAYIQANRSVIGGMESLPFLFKVLSIAKPLSIQVHPNKQQAEELHAKFPDIYKDPNHKPELAIALTYFLALCGFRTHADLHAQLSSQQPLVDLIGSAEIAQLLTDQTDESIKKCYTKLLHAPQTAIDNCIAQLALTFGDENNQELIAKVFRHANTNFPNDVGTLSIFFLNIIELQPGDAIYLSANVPHAYLLGDCIECMACSDNVIRAGLTPKFKDVETLLGSLVYTGSTAEQKLFRPVSVGPHSQLFSPPVKDFAVVRIDVPAGVGQYAIENRAFGSILLVLDGEADATTQGGQVTSLKPGSILFMPADAKSVGLKVKSANGFVAFQALYNDF